MINLDSDLARAAPGVDLPGRRPSRDRRAGTSTCWTWVIPDAYAYIADRLHELLDTYEIAYLKWDHNRMVTEAGHTPSGTPGVHVQTLAVYRLMDELRAAASRSGDRKVRRRWRPDRSGDPRAHRPGVAQRLHRRPGSAADQPLHPAADPAGTDRNACGSADGAHHPAASLALPFRAAAALWGHMGIEWNLAEATAAERSELAGWVTLHKELRGLLHHGTVVVGDHPDPAIWVNGVVELATGARRSTASPRWPDPSPGLPAGCASPVWTPTNTMR